MPEDKWRDYWERYKPSTNKLSLPKIKISDKTHILLIVSLLAIVVLGFITFRTGRYANVLKTDMENQLNLCEEETENISYYLGTCEADLTICLSNVTSKAVALETCEREKEEESCPSPDVWQKRYSILGENYAKDVCCKTTGYKTYIIDGSTLRIICRKDDDGRELIC